MEIHRLSDGAAAGIPGRPGCFYRVKTQRGGSCRVRRSALLSVRTDSLPENWDERDWLFFPEFIVRSRCLVRGFDEPATVYVPPRNPAKMRNREERDRISPRRTADGSSYFQRGFSGFSPAALY